MRKQLVVIVALLIGFLSPLIPNARGEEKRIQDSWNGEWIRKGSEMFSLSTLKIYGITDRQFGFDIFASSGGNTGEMNGVAIYVGMKGAFVGPEEDPCSINFEFKARTVVVTTTGGCSMYGGAGVSFAGEYAKDIAEPERQSLKERGVFKTKEAEKAFSELVGWHYEEFLETAHKMTEEKELDGFSAKVYSFGVEGLFTIQESIIMVGKTGKIWAALLYPEDGGKGKKLWYFTNDSRFEKQIPKTIAVWRKRFSDMKVNFQKPKT